MGQALQVELVTGDPGTGRTLVVLASREQRSGKVSGVGGGPVRVELAALTSEVS